MLFIFWKFVILLVMMEKLIERQRLFFNNGYTFKVSKRKQLLKSLRETILKKEKEIEKALFDDLGKSKEEVFLSETSQIISEIDFFVQNINHLSAPTKVQPSFINFPSKDYIIHEPYGLTLHIAPWNYPFQLALTPLVGAIAAGNAVVLKPSENAPHTAEILQKIVDIVFPPEWVKVIQGGPEIAQKLLTFRWDYIFFTGGLSVAKKVAQAAANHLTPVTLELGGKNPCIVDQTANIKVTARRIVFGKFLNCGQTCIAPDYILAHQSIVEYLTFALQKEIERSYSENPEQSEEYGRIVNAHHFDRLTSLLYNQEIAYGGKTNEHTKYIQPTLLRVTDLSSLVMKEEIFGPLLPIIPYQDENEIKEVITQYEKSLSFYVFSERKGWAKKLMNTFSFGGGVINDTVIQFTNRNLPFGGIGHSGLGAYHGKTSFHTFSHQKPYIHRSTRFDFKARYAPYKKSLPLVKFFLKYLQ